MEHTARQLAGLIENIMHYFGTPGSGEECCETITPGEFRALHTILHQPLCSMQDIAKKALVTKSGATRLVGRLEAKGLAHREQDKNDGRVCCVKLTGAGTSLLNRIEDQLTNRMMPILTAMDPAMREILMISLEAFLQAAHEKRE